jgi:hypothetical protein
MNRIVKTAVAVAAFGLAAALAVPVQAEARYDTAGRAPAEDPGGTGGDPLGGLLSGLFGGELTGGLVGGLLDEADSTEAGPIGAEWDATHAGRHRHTDRSGASEDVIREEGPLPVLSPIVSGVPLGGGGLTESLPVLSGAARTVQDTAGSAQDTAGSAQGAAGQAAPAEVVPPTGALSTGALPTGALSTGALPTGALPGITRAVGVDELTPLVKKAAGAVHAKGAEVVGSSNHLIVALGWTAGSLTGSARDSGVRGQA